MMSYYDMERMFSFYDISIFSSILYVIISGICINSTAYINLKTAFIPSKKCIFYQSVRRICQKIRLVINSPDNTHTLCQAQSTSCRTGSPSFSVGQHFLRRCQYCFGANPIVSLRAIFPLYPSPAQQLIHRCVKQGQVGLSVTTWNLGNTAFNSTVI